MFLNKLEEINARICRAGNQIDSLKADMDRFCTNIRQSIVREVCDEHDEQQWVFQGETPNTPIEWSLRVGEILHNLRSTLDHLVCQLILDNGQEPTKENAYPIFKDESMWSNKDYRDGLNGVPSTIKTIIEKHLEPYTGGINLPFDVSAFETLRTFCNIDKHQHTHRFIVQASVTGISDIRENHPLLNSSRTIPSPQPREFPGNLEKDKILLCYDNVSIKMYPSFLVEVRFEYAPDAQEYELPARTVPDILQEWHKAVAGAVRLVSNGSI